MRTLIAIFLLCTLTFPFALKTGIIANYVINKQYYAEVLCENQDKPEMECDGKCHLAKELRVTEATQEKSSLPVFPSVKLELSLFLLKPIDALLGMPLEMKIPVFSTMEITCVAGYFGEIFHPPQLS